MENTLFFFNQSPGPPALPRLRAHVMLSLWSLGCAASVLSAHVTDALPCCRACEHGASGARDRLKQTSALTLSPLSAMLGTVLPALRCWWVACSVIGCRTCASCGNGTGKGRSIRMLDLDQEMGAAPLPNTTCLHPSHTAKSALYKVTLHVSTTTSWMSMILRQPGALTGHQARAWQQCR